MSALTLFDPLPPPIPIGIEEGGRYKLRSYQREDALATIAAWNAGHRGVVNRSATGLGKSVLISELCRLRLGTGRIMVTVDVGSLASDLYNSISYHTDERVGLLTGEVKERLDAPIIVSTIQTLYGKRRGGTKRYQRDIDPDEFSTLIIDECESSIADEFSSVVKYFLSNPDLKMCGTTATPFRGDGRGMGELFDHAINEPGPLNRDILWGRDEGWLVGVKQAFVRISVDFNTLKVRKRESGDRDYSDDDVARLIGDEQHLVEFAKGIHRVAGNEPSMVIMPSIETAEKLTGHLNNEIDNYAMAAHGDIGREEARRVIHQFKRGDFPCIVSVQMLYKGFDSDRVRFVFIGRKTKSRRVYEQSIGRGVRPLQSIRHQLQAASTANERRQIIASSEKPYATIVDLVGLKPSVKDLGVIDILGDSLPEAARERAKQKVLETDDIESVTINAPDEDARRARAEIEAEEKARREREMKKRKSYQVNANVDVEVTDDLGATGGARSRVAVSHGVMHVLKSANLPEREIDYLSRHPDKAAEMSRDIMARRKSGRLSIKQERFLSRYFPKDEVTRLSTQQASKAFEAVKENGWIRPRESLGQLIGGVS